MAADKDAQARDRHKDEARDQKQHSDVKNNFGGKSNRANKSASKLEPGESATTTDHFVIQQWVEERGGVPATVKDTEGGDEPGLLRIDFPGRGVEQSLDEISWDAFFKTFEENKLAFLYEERTNSGEVSRFSKFVSREND